jgi:S-adenosylmethionine:tRNA ribosyltransferase-isomerase
VLRASDLDYDLPSSLIATSPAHPRDSARLLVVSRSDSSRLEHAHVRDLPGLLAPMDLLVFNTTRVLPARVIGRRGDTGGRVEGLYLREGGEPGVWVMLLRGRRLRPGVVVGLFVGVRPPLTASGVTLTLLETIPDEPGAWVVRVDGGPTGTERTLERVGSPPLPPYIRKARRSSGQAEDDPTDRERYQTVYADRGGSVAAPTAGLHFTPELLEELTRRGIGRAEVVLHVGAGTFKPVEAEFVERHAMHAEWCSMSSASRDAIVRARAGRGAPAAGAGGSAGQGRVICVGTTAARTVETYAALSEGPPSVLTRLLITPGYRWRWTDGLLTNFHLPRSTLMALVASLLPGGAARLKEIYAEAVSRGYRFYSFGDAMLVLP